MVPGLTPHWLADANTGRSHLERSSRIAHALAWALGGATFVAHPPTIAKAIKAEVILNFIHHIHCFFG
jgi:hypothetical protein